MFGRNYSTPGPGIDPNAPEKTGLARFFEILQLEAGTLIKLNLLFLLTCLLVVTAPLALFAMNQVVRKMVQDQPVLCLYDYRTAIRQGWRQAYAAFFLTAVPMAVSSVGMRFYLGQAAQNPLLFVPFMLCSTVFLVTLLSGFYLYGLLGAGVGVKRAIRTALLLCLGKPLRAVLAVWACYGPLILALLAFPLSGLYFLLIGFSLSCLLGNFFVRTILKQYGGLPPENTEEEGAGRDNDL